jgi:hypothetical protein
VDVEDPLRDALVGVFRRNDESEHDREADEPRRESGEKRDAPNRGQGAQSGFTR